MRLVHVQLRKREHEFGSGEMRCNRKRGSGQRFLALCWSYYTSSLRQARCNTHNSRRHGHLETSKDRSDADLGMTGRKKKRDPLPRSEMVLRRRIAEPSKGIKNVEMVCFNKAKTPTRNNELRGSDRHRAVTFSLELRVMMSRTLHKGGFVCRQVSTVLQP